MSVTLRDVAKHVNLSHATVSMVLNDRRDVAIPESTRQRVLKAAQELGYRPNLSARALASGRTNMVALWSPSSLNSFYSEILFAIQRYAQAYGNDLVFREVAFHPDRMADNLRSLALPVDGILAVDSKYALEAIQDQPQLVNKPIVSIGVYTCDAFDSVQVDLEAGVYAALDHLWTTGHRRIGFLNVQNAVDVDDPRHRAYDDFCRRHGIEQEVITVPSAVRERVQEAICAVAEEGHLPEALLCYNDHLAMGVVKGLKAAAIPIPDRCAIVGCDGVAESEYVEPPLSTIIQPIEAMCRLGWEYLRSRIENPDLDIRRTRLEPELVIRGSSVSAN